MTNYHYLDEYFFCILTLSVAIRSSSATWCSPKPRLQSACSGKAASWCAGPLASVFRCSIWLPVSLFFFSDDCLIIFHGRSVSRGWTDYLHSSTAVNFKASISSSDFCARAHAGSTEYLNPASQLLFSIFISFKLVAAKPLGRLF